MDAKVLRALSAGVKGAHKGSAPSVNATAYEVGSSRSSATLDFFAGSSGTSSSSTKPVHAGKKRPRAAQEDMPRGRTLQPVEAEHRRAEDSTSRSSRSTATDEEVAVFRKHMGIRIQGAACPDPFASFEDIPRQLPRDALRLLEPVGGSGSQQARHATVREAILRNIEESAYKEPTPIQMQSLPSLLACRDTLGIAPTGSGKTAAFTLPMLLLLQEHCHAGPRGLVLTPTKELAHQTAREIDRLGATLGLVTVVLTKQVARSASHSRISASSDAAELVMQKDKRGARRERAHDSSAGEDDVLRWSDDEDLDGAAATSALAPNHETAAASSGAVRAPALPVCDILVATPLMLVAALRHDGAGADVILPHLRYVVIDEADKLLELGFLEQVDAILDAFPSAEKLARWHASTASSSTTAAAASEPLPARGGPVCGMFTATMSSGIEELAMAVLKDPLRLTVGTRGASSSNVSQRLVFVGKEEGKLLEIRNMLSRGVATPALIFVQSKDRAELLARTLRVEGVSVDVIHSDRTDAQREAAVTAFRRGEVSFLIATDLLGRGLDFKGVNLVINFDLPQTGVSYVHRVGRTGRAGRHGEAITLFTEDDIPMLRTIANVMKQSGCDVPEYMLSIKKLERKEKKRLQHAPPRRRDFRPGQGRGPGKGRAT